MINKTLLTTIILTLIISVFATAVSVQGSTNNMKINEVVSNPNSGREWIEVYNDGAGSVDLSYCKIQDKIGTPLFLTGTIGSNEFLVFEYSQSVLNNAGDTVSLVCNGETIDTMGYGDSGNAPNPGKGKSVGRCEDGEDTSNDENDFMIMNPTKGTENECSTTNDENEPICGNDELETGEECDDGNTENGDGCSNTCKIENEEPDPCDILGCDPEPIFSVCGNNQIEIGEECDDGNTENGDGCSNTCKIENEEEPTNPECGNGIIETGEECDGGSRCSNTCTIITNNQDQNPLGKGVGIGVDIITEDFEPQVWMCDSRTVFDDNTEPGRDFDCSCDKSSCSAMEIISYTPGKRADGRDIPAERSDPTKALGPPQNDDTLNFVSLGFGGELVVKFNKRIINEPGRDGIIIETSYGSPSCAAYPEKMEVYAKKELGDSWTYIGSGCQDSSFGLGPLDWAQYVRIVDKSDPRSFPGSADGYDVDGIIAASCQNSCCNGLFDEEKEILVERMNNYAFEGEQIQWRTLVMDKNGIEKIKDVYGTIGTSQGKGNDIEVNCNFEGRAYEVEESCNARILEEQLKGDLSEVAGYYTCTLTVETPDSMYGEHFITVEAEDLDGEMGTADENEYWFLNPAIALSVDGSLEFNNGVRPGTSSYSDTLLIGNDADSGSGVRLDMFISGTDFYDSSSSGAMCPTTNQLSLDAFSYYATKGAYSSLKDPRSDFEGYLPINYGTGFNDPNPFYDTHEILQTNPMNGPYYQSNILSPGAEFALTFRLNLPEPCNGDFDTGSIYFWGEAI